MAGWGGGDEPLSDCLPACLSACLSVWLSGWLVDCLSISLRADQAGKGVSALSLFDNCVRSTRGKPAQPGVRALPHTSSAISGDFPSGPWASPSCGGDGRS
jgi:hypothetical protein